MSQTTNFDISPKGVSSLWIYFQAGLYLLGFMLLFVINVMFSNLNEDLRDQIRNEQSRLAIGELIVLDLKQIESAFYQMATTSNLRGQEYVRRQLQKGVDDLRDILIVLDEGGVIERETHLNIESQELMRRVVEYIIPDNNSTFVLEFIDLWPKMAQIEEEADKLLFLLKEREKYKKSGNSEAYMSSIHQIKSYLITLPQLFVRARENANRLFFQSQKRLHKLEQDIEAQISYYRTLQLGLSIFVMLSVIVIGYFILRQVEQSKKRLQRLAKDLEFQKFALDAHAIVSATDVNGNIVYANDKFCSISGYTREELLGSSHRIFKSDQHNKTFFRQLWQTITAGDVWHGEIKNRSKSGVDNWFSATIVPLCDEDGKPFQYFAIRTDITERKEMEYTIQENHRFLLSLTDTIGEGVYAVNSEGRCTFINPKGLELIGYKESEVLSRDIHSLIHHHDESGGEVSAIDCPILQSIMQKNSYASDNEWFYNKDNQIFPVSVNAVPIFHDGEFDGHVVVFQDISLRKEAELSLQNAKLQAEEANKAKSQFLANMSHEIRTPMNAIIGMSHLALQTDLTPKQHNYLDKIHRAAESLLRVINDILDLSKVEAGKMDIEKSDFFVSALFEDLTDMLSLKTEGKGLELCFEIDPNIPNGLVGDAMRLNQVLLNLCNNAVKFTEAGKITVSVSVSAQDTSTVELLFSVKDTGVGMTKEQKAKLFKPFSQADASTTRKYGGTGLGLSICKKLVSLMDGDIWVDSKRHIGSTFYFTAKFKKQAAVQAKNGNKSLLSDLISADKPSESEGGISTDLGGHRVLLAEDNKFNQEVAVDLLEGWNLDVSVAENGQQALEMLESEFFDIVLMDCQMPVMDGYTATKKIRQNKIFGKVPVIAMTANAMNDDIEQMYRSGMDDRIAKPINVEKMFATLMKWITKEEDVVVSPSIVSMSGRQKDNNGAIKGELDFSPLEVIDSKLAMRRLQISQSGYLNLLTKFAENEADIISRIREAEQNDKRDTVMRLIHTLKGTSGSIGATALQKLATECEMVLRANNHFGDYQQVAEEWAANLNTLESELNVVLRNIAALDTHIQVPDTKERSGDYSNLLEELKQKLNDFDGESEELMIQLLKMDLTPDVRKQCNIAAKAIDQYDFEAALAVLNTLG